MRPVTGRVKHYAGMKRLNRRAIGLAICLASMAGCVDAIGFLHLGGFFISFMSGNSTQMMVGLVDGQWLRGLQFAGILALFVLGTLSGTLIGYAGRVEQHAVRVLGLVTLMLAGAALSFALGWPIVTVILMTLAMGAENAVFQRDGDVVVGLTYMTGTLVKVGQKLAQTMRGGPAFDWAPYLLLWLGLVCGGGVGAVLYHHLGLNSLWLVAGWAAAMMLYAALDKQATG
ncbi:MAG: YoaK family protein [Asticcacaulis sp.]